MKPQTFDRLAHAAADFRSRRAILHGLAGIALGVGILRRGDSVDAKKKRKHKHKKREEPAQPNEFGCIEVGERCTSKEQCCSAICEGKKGRKTCRSHHTGTCPQGGAGHCTDPDPARWSCNGTSDCACVRTTAGSDACVADAPSGVDYCTDCQRDSDCEAIGYPEGSVCLPLHEGYCVSTCPNQRACFPPCGAEWPIL